MSEGAGAKSKSKYNVLSDDFLSDLYDPFAEEAANSILSDTDYREWNDADLNAEIWTDSKGKTEPKVRFEDWDFNRSPPGMEDNIASWKRPDEVFIGAPLLLYDPSNKNFVLQVPSPKGSCDLFQTFIENVTTLQFLAFKYGFSFELETAGYVPNTHGEHWRPWHHIYSLCKAGKGTVHKPEYNPQGKYIVRLFYLGTWRRFLVDDQVPIDKNGLCLFPVTQVVGEIWPILLIKVLLKIFLFPPFHKDIPFFSIFTGWVECSIMARNKTYEELWRRLTLFTPKYEVPVDEATEMSNPVVSSKKGTAKESVATKDDEFCLVFGNLKLLNENRSKGMIVVKMHRDIPLKKANRRASTKPWKKVRWTYWALKKGIWTDESKLPPYRRIFCINFIKELGKLLAPDPRHETLLFEVENNEESKASIHSKYLGSEEWYDYNKFYDYLVSLHVYFKPTVFLSNFKISSLIPPKVESPKKEKETASRGKATAKPRPTVSSRLFFSPMLERNTNEPPLLFCESSTGIFICISLWVSSECLKSCNYVRGVPLFLRCSYASLLVERFDWRSPLQGKIIGATKTVGASSIALNLKPGRHVLKLWLSTKCQYVLSIYSNVNVHVHKGPKIRYLLNNEGERVLQYINKVSAAFIALTQKFGKPDLPASLREFYSIIKPGNDAAPNYLGKMDDFIETFLYSILLSLKSLVVSTDELKIMMGALQSLFFNPKIYCSLPKSTTPFVIGGGPKKTRKKVESVPNPERTLSEILSLPLTPTHIEKIVSVQKVFRGYRTRLLWKYQTPARKEFKPYTERLKKICETIFIPSKREVEVGKLIRKIFVDHPDLLTTFKFHNDFQNIIDILEFTGKIANVEPYAWVPITRFMIKCNSEFPIPCAFYLSCNLEQFVIHGADNDTNEEIFRVTNCISPRYYHPNDKGYTIFVHGWNASKFKTVHWRMQMVRMKYFDSLRLCNMTMSYCSQNTLPVIEVFELKNFYIPNSKGRICRCLIKIQQRTLLTLRLSASYSGVNFVLTIATDKRNLDAQLNTINAREVIAKVHSVNGAALISSLYLDHSGYDNMGETESDFTIYVLEATVVNNSWPLTKHEWGVIEPLRTNRGAARRPSSISQVKKVASESRKKGSRATQTSEVKLFESPFWFLQVLNEPPPQGSDSVDELVIEEDKSYDDFVRIMKYQWEEKDLGRRNRGYQLRKNFLHTIWVESKKLTDESSEGAFEFIQAEDDVTCYDFDLLLKRMSSFSYLLEDRSIQRYTKSPRVLPKMPTYDLLLKYKKEESEPSVGSNIVSGATTLSTSTEQNGNLLHELELQQFDFLMMCIHCRQVMSDHMKSEQTLSAKLMKEAYDGRLRALKNLLRTA